MDIKLKVTGDGSRTFFVPELNENYHSTNGAITEALHVFIKGGLLFLEKQQIRILEIGLGTGLNAFLSLLEAEKHNLKIDYTAIELFPLAEEHIRKLNYHSITGIGQKELFFKIHSVLWEEKVSLTAGFSLHKIRIDFTKDNVKADHPGFDLVYFDAFGPDKQPEMWTETVFRKIHNLMADDGILVTYSAKGAVRRTLQSVGFSVERIPGPPGKREMIRAAKASKKEAY